jgi:hypothetical protein
MLVSMSCLLLDFGADPSLLNKRNAPALPEDVVEQLGGTGSVVPVSATVDTANVGDFASTVLRPNNMIRQAFNRRREEKALRKRERLERRAKAHDQPASAGDSTRSRAMKRQIKAKTRGVGFPRPCSVVLFCCVACSASLRC